MLGGVENIIMSLFKTNISKYNCQHCVKGWKKKLRKPKNKQSEHNKKCIKSF